MFLIVTLVNVSIWRFYVIAYDIKQIKEHDKQNHIWNNKSKKHKNIWIRFNLIGQTRHFFILIEKKRTQTNRSQIKRWETEANI